MNDKLIVTQVSADDEVYRVANNSHDDPSEHTYQVFLAEGEPVHCECPSWEYHEGECKHMQAVVDKLASRQHWMDWQQVQKQKEERERKQAMEAAQERVSEDESVGSELAKEMLAEAKETKQEIMSKDEWREMSSEGRQRAVAFL